MQFHQLRQWLLRFSQKRLSIFSEHHDRFCACHSALFVPTDLEQLRHPTAIRERKQSKSGTKKDPSIQTLKFKQEFSAAFGLQAEPVIAGIEQPWAFTMASIGEAQLTRILPAHLIVFQLPVIFVKTFEKTMLNQISEPETITGRAIKLDKKAVLFLRVGALTASCKTDTFFGVTLWMMRHQRGFVPEYPLHGHCPPLDLYICNGPGVSVDFRNGIDLLKMIGESHFLCFHLPF